MSRTVAIYSWNNSMCTNLAVLSGAKSQYRVTARTMDFGTDFSTDVCLIPRGQSFPTLPPANPITWTNQYGFIGMVMDSQYLPTQTWYFTDGMNEKGLSAACLWLPGTQYATPTTSGSPKNLHNADVVGWLLGNFATVAEVMEQLSSINIIDVKIWKDQIHAPLHWMVNDANGDHLVIEMMNGTMKVYSNRTSPGIPPLMTNAPSYDWQLTNQTTYVDLSLTNNTQQFWGQEINGSGLIGMPGDATPPSRFARANMLRQSTFQPTGTQQAIGLAQQVIQNLVVPYGTVLTNGGAKDADHTQWTVVRDHKNLVYYFSTAFNNNLFAINLTSINFGTAKKNKMAAVQPTWFTDVTSKLKGVSIEEPAEETTA